MLGRSHLKKAILLLTFLPLIFMAGKDPLVWALILNVRCPSVLSITDDTGPFTLNFSDFVRGSQSTTQLVTYRVQSNNMSAGTVVGAVSAKLGALFEETTVEGDVAGYQNQGDSNFATLAESKSGYQKIVTDPTSLADKHPGSGSGDVCLDGSLRISWRATLTKDTPAGSASQFLVVTLKEGS